jgi:hypothetical protein
MEWKSPVAGFERSPKKEAALWKIAAETVSGYKVTILRKEIRLSCHQCNYNDKLILKGV